MMEVIAVCISEKKGERKHPVPEITLRCGHGIVGDAHAGNWHRQVSLLPEESVDTMRAPGLELHPGDFAENILTRGIALKTLPVGTRLRVGETVLEITQIGKHRLMRFTLCLGSSRKLSAGHYRNPKFLCHYL